jgi:hypothetical protein
MPRIIRVSSCECHLDGRRLSISRLTTTAAAEEPTDGTLFLTLGPSHRPLSCAAHEVETGLELRLSFGNDVMRTQFSAESIAMSGSPKQRIAGISSCSKKAFRKFLCKSRENLSR